FMSLVIICLILGLALCVERILYLSFSKTNTKKLLAKIESALQEGGVEAAKEVCRSTRGPVASIFYQGLLRMDQGIDVVEKTVVSYGSVQMSQMESGLSWISLFIAIAPSLGFLGTVIGMIEAFDAIQAAGDISPNVVAGGMKVALITTVGGLIVAVILQIFYNYILSMIDGLSIQMEDASISLVDTLVKYQSK
ncbi:MAG: MotA/TolQ/ExbB proton channel family protein, partial [Bacteroidales bacterium]|nr:MotA/TolQ/ExbB proton channel family protein [Bacteroidales bacterium]